VADKTEKPTPKRLRDARRDGKVARSAEFGGALAALAVFALAYGLAVLGWDTVVAGVRTIIRTLTRRPELADASQFMFVTGAVVLAFSGALCAVGALVGALVGFLQTGGVFSSKPLSPDPSKLNPIAGLKRIFSLRTVAVGIAVALKLGIVYAVAADTLDDVRRSLGSYLLLAGPDMIAALAAPIASLAAAVLIGSLAMGCVDLLVQRTLFMKDMKQDRHEVKQDYKEMEGDPLIKSRRKSIGLSDMFEGQSARVKRSTVIVTNPTHLCIGLRYDPDGDAPVPIVTLLAEDEVAADVRRLATLHRVPTVEWVWLARRLYADAPLDAPVPDALLAQVADVLAWLHLRGLGSEADWVGPDPDRTP
jgi:type III secretion protein U